MAPLPAYSSGHPTSAAAGLCAAPLTILLLRYVTSPLHHLGTLAVVDKQTEFVLRNRGARRPLRPNVVHRRSRALKSVAIAPAELEGAFAEGMGFDGSAIEGFARVYESDMVAHPDPATFQVLPWRDVSPATARMFCDISMPDGLFLVRRSALRAQGR